jgi:hypothetical protein
MNEGAGKGKGISGETGGKERKERRDTKGEEEKREMKETDPIEKQ